MQERIKFAWMNIIRVLQSAGYSQKALAEKVGVNQSTICRLADGEGPEPRWSVGSVLIELAGGRAALAGQGIDLGDCEQSIPTPESVALPAAPIALTLAERRERDLPIDFPDRRTPATTGES